MIRHFTVASLLVASVLATPAAAQQVPTVQAGAGGRYETQIDPKTRVPGFSSAQVTAFRSQMDRVIASFAAMPQVTAPPAPICHRLSSWVEVQAPHGLLSGAVYMMSPISFDNGRCHRMTGTGVEVRFNALSLLADPQQAFHRPSDAPSDWFLLPQASLAARVVRFENAIGFTHGRVPLFRPVSAERYLREMLSHQPADPEGGSGGELARWLAEEKPAMLAENAKQLREMAAFMKPADLEKIAEAQRAGVEGMEQHYRSAAKNNRGPSERQRLEAELASLGSARSAPACIVPGPLTLDATPGCPNGLVLAELNPGYFDMSRPEAVQLLVIDTPKGRTHGENDARLAARMAVWNALDHDALAALVR